MIRRAIKVLNRGATMYRERFVSRDNLSNYEIRASKDLEIMSS